MPLDPILRGIIQNAIITGIAHSTWSPTKGATTVIEYTGTQALVVPYALTLQQAKWETSIEQGPVWKLTATYPEDLITGNPSLPEPTWTIEPHPYERSILECTDRPMVRGLSTKTKELIEYAVKNPNTSYPLTPLNETSQFQSAYDVYRLMRVGIEGREEDALIVRRSLITSRFYNPNWALNNNGFVLSKGFLVSNYFVDSATAAALPNSSAAITADNPDDPVYYYFGYKESRPTRTTMPNQKVQWDQLWVLNKWSAGAKGLYDVIS